MYQSIFSGASWGTSAVPDSGWGRWGSYERYTEAPGPGAYFLYPVLPAKVGQQFTISLGWVITPTRGVAQVTISNGAGWDRVFAIDQTQSPADYARLNSLTYQTIQDPVAGSIDCVDLIQVASSGQSFSVRLEKLGGSTGDGHQVVADFLLYSSPQPIPKPAMLQRAVISPSGKSLVLFVSDLGGSPSPLQTLVGAPTITVSGSAPVALQNPVWSAAESLPYVLYPLTGPSGVLGSPVAPGAEVKISCPDGWATALAGEVSAVSDLVASRAEKSLLPLFEETTKTMGVGYNIGPPGLATSESIYANLIRNKDPWFDNVTTDLNTGYPKALTSGYYAWTGAVAPFANVIQSGPPGVYTVQYRTSIPDLVVSLGSVAADQVMGPLSRENLPDGRVRIKRNYEPRGDFGVSVIINIARSADLSVDPYATFYRVSAPYDIDLRDLEVFPPGVDPDNPPLFNSEMFRIAGKSRTIRFLEAFPWEARDFEDLSSPTTSLSYASGVTKSTKVQSIAPYVGTDWFVPPFGKDGTPILFTFSEPHGLKEGNLANSSGFVGPNGDGTFPIGGGHYFEGPQTGQPGPGGTTQLNGLNVMTHVISPTEIVLRCPGIESVNGTVLLGTFTDLGPNAVISGTTKTMIPPQDCMEFCNQLSRLNGIPCYPWINVPFNATDECITEMFGVFARTLDRNLKMRCEYSNETWNWYFPQAAYCWDRGMRDTPPISANWWAVKRSGEVFALARAAFVAAGRPATDVIRVLGTQGMWSYIASDRVQYAVDNHIDFDELAPAFYFGSGPNDQSLASVYDSMDRDQIMDVGQTHMGYSGFIEGVVKSNQDVLNRLYPTAKLVAYEGGPGSADLTTNATEPDRTPTLAHRSQAWAHGSGMYHIMLSFLQKIQDNGCTTFSDFQLCGIPNTEVVKGDSNWTAYLRWNQPGGVGDGSDGLFNNDSSPLDYARIVSVVGGAINTWNDLVKKEAVTDSGWSGRGDRPVRRQMGGRGR